MFRSRKCPYSSHRRDYKFMGEGGGGGVKEMYEVSLALPEG